MWDIRYIIKDIIKTKNIQKFINNRFKNDDDKMVVSTKILTCLKSVETIYGGEFLVDDMFETLLDVETCYHVDDIQETDVVLDIGACIGGFTLKVNSTVSHVYAVEPVMSERLKKNIELSNAKNVTVIDEALGEGIIDIDWSGYRKKIRAISLPEIISLCGGHVDFVKIDCEGGEWYVKPEHLKGIRRIEAEVHNFDGKHDFKEFLAILDRARFDYKYEIYNEVLMIVHAKNDGQ